MPERRTRTHGVDSARRVLQLLLLFSGERVELTVDDIARELSISVPSAYRFISLLREMYLLEERNRGSYALSPRVFALARNADRAFDIGAHARPVLERLRTSTGEAALIMRRVGDSAVCLDTCQIEHPIKLSFVPGQVMSLHRGAGPKVLLTSMGSSWASEYFERIEPRPSAAERDTVLAELPTIEQQGWAQSASEVDEGIWAMAAPVRMGGEVVAAITVAGPQYRINNDRARHITQEVIDAADEVSRALSSWVS